MAIIIMYLALIINSKRLPRENVLYAYAVSVVVFAAFLTYEYYKSKYLYKQLYNMLKSEEDLNYSLNIKDAKTNEQRVYVEILSKIYKINSEKISEYEDKQKEYIYFILDFSLVSNKCLVLTFI